MATIDIRPFEAEHSLDVARLATTVQWPSLADPDVVRQVCEAPGSTAFVAIDTGTDRVVGWAQALSDGVLEAHLSFLAVHPDHRRCGIARLLLVATFQSTGAKRLDLITDEDAAGFYEEFEHRAMRGFRLYPGS